ncbi:hypothetical protein C8R46DRAFT_1128997 [Mycena filopes]|nr:hypothetical protein C8R46DRAFT_1128997 [Mycena filopes]
MQSEMQTLRNELMGLRADMDIAKRQQIAAEAEATQARKVAEAAEANGKGPVNRQIIRSVHGVTLQMLGMNPDTKDVPEPYTVGDELRYEDEAKTVPLFIYEWSQSVNSVHNLEGINRVVNTVTANETAESTWEGLASPADLRADITRSAVAYFASKQRVWKSQGSAARAAKALAMAHASMVRGRQRRKAAYRRAPAVVKAFQDKYGVANCQGLDALILTDNMSQDLSDYGAVSDDTWQARCATTNNEDALESIILRWRATKLHRIFIRLDRFIRDAAPPSAAKALRVHLIRST